MSVASPTTHHLSQMTGAQALVAALVRHGITAGFGIPSIHNIAVYDALRQTPEFHHWVVRHEQAAGYAADGFYRRSGQIAAIFASTGPGNLFTLVPLLESLQNNIPVLLIGTNIASSMLSKTGGALHETPDQLEIIRPSHALCPASRQSGCSDRDDFRSCGRSSRTYARDLLLLRYHTTFFLPP